MSKSVPCAEFALKGFLTEPNFISVQLAQSFSDRLDQSGVYKHVSAENVYTKTGKSTHFSIDRIAVQKIIPEAEDLYSRTLKVVSSKVSNLAGTSPFIRSAYYVKKYVPPDGEQGWHHDTNSISAVLYLTDNFDGVTEIICKDGMTRYIHPQAGKLLILDGTRLWHQATKVQTSPKVTLIMNFYLPGHPERPNWLDEKIFGK